METIKIAGFGGSLRKESYNRYLLENAVNLMPENSELKILDIKNFPLMNQDEENNYPENVKNFKKQVRDADGLLIVTPEYNYSVPGYLKNVLDVASRPYGDNPFEGKPVAIMSASIGMLGGSRAQYHLRQSCVFLNMIPVNMPEVFVTFAQQKFDENGKLTDDMTAKFAGQLLNNLVNLARDIKKIRH
ncbi:MAG: NAD(P)H-dependent oxidoreductase [Ferroplasma sp.]|jgi:chromate reductase|uniref:NADPH-dependent FMN reductase n=1 Tax=Ferroplasma sp. TaxID=2591003 RepID=UPI00281651FE|nr:NAD(P)H-dependent oxidoreductase [Ferroplasma sp.]WMT51539.1 MAG: NAD(P)H-dependent oxidoreductase [Ferroplasma sp.]